MFAYRPHLRLRPAFAITVLAVALALRLYIVAKGGAFYWTDEKRYNATREAVAAALVGDWSGAKKELLSGSDHIGFRWLALPPAITERLLYADDPPTAKLCSAWFSLFSVVNLALIWLIARRSGMRSGEAEWALAFAATSNALFYFSRHCVPYDAALTFFLAAMFVSADPNPRRRPFLVGVLCGLGYLVYNGYWSVGAVVCLLDMARHPGGFAVQLRSAARLFAGVVTPVLVVFATSAAAGYNLVADSLQFAASVNQGDFGDGWRFIPEYLWAADGIAVVLLGSLVVSGAAVSVATGRRERWLLWVAAAVVLIATWLVFSDVLRKFVLYGRTVRALVPFLALGAGGAVMFLRERLERRLAALPAIAAAGGCLAGVYMMRTPLQQIFPREFRPMAEHEVARILANKPDAVLRSVYDDYMASPEPAEVPPGRVLLQAPHPHQYLPYLFEGYTREQRPRYLAGDRSMRLIEVDPQPVATDANREPLFGGNHGPVELVLRFPADAPGRSQVLVSCGTTGAGDQLYVIYQDAEHVRFGLDHWGGAPLVSDAIAVRPGAEHHIILSIGSLFPPADDPEYRHSPEACFLKRWLYLAVDGTVVFSRPFDSYAARQDSVHFGRSVIGGSNADPVFSGKLIAVHHRTPASLGLTERALAWPATGTFTQTGHVGAVRLTIELPDSWTPGKEPLLVAGTPPNLDVLFLRYVGSNHLRIGYRHGREPEVQSDAVPVESGTTHHIEFALPALSGRDVPASHRTVLLDGNPALRLSTPLLEAPANAIHLGFMPGRLEGMRPQFSGRVTSIEPAPSTP